MSSQMSKLLLTVAAILYLYFIGGYLNNPMTNSIADLTIAMVDDHTLRINPYAGNSLDVSRYQGHFYSGMPPGLSVLMIPIYIITKIPLSFVPAPALAKLDHFIDENLSKKHGAIFWTQKRSTVVILLILSTCLIAVPLTLISFKKFIELTSHLNLVQSKSYFLFFCVFLLLGSPLADFTATLYHNTVAALLLWLVFATRVIHWGKKISATHLFFIGFTCGMCPTLDYPSLVYTLIILGFVFISLPPENKKIKGIQLISIFIGYALPLSALLLYHNEAFGSFLANAYQFRDPDAGHATPLINAELAEQGWKTFLPSIAKLSRTFFHPWCSLIIYNPLILLSLAMSPIYFFKSNLLKDKALWSTVFLLCFSNFWFYTTLPLAVPPFVGSFGARYTIYSVFFSILCLIQFSKKSTQIVNKITILTCILAMIPTWLYLFYGSPPRTLSEYWALFLNIGPANYTLTKLYEGRFLQSSFWSWMSFLILLSVCMFYARTQILKKT